MKSITKTTRTFCYFLFICSAYAATPDDVATSTIEPAPQNLLAVRALPAAPVLIAPITVPTREERAIRRWKVSLIPLAASQTLDISSSWGMRELNPVLAGRDGTFGAQGALVKAGIVGAFVGVEYLIVRHHPNAAKALEKINWSGAALTSSFAVHNYAIR